MKVSKDSSRLLRPFHRQTNVGVVNFELKSSLINMVQASSFCNKLNDDANAYLQNVLELCEAVVIRGVATDAIKLRLFPFSLLGKVKWWFYKEKVPSTHGINAPWRSSQSFSCWAKQMSCAGKFQVSNRRGWNSSRKHKKGCKRTSWLAPIIEWTNGSSFKTSTMG